MVASKNGEKARRVARDRAVEAEANTDGTKLVQEVQPSANSSNGLFLEVPGEEPAFVHEFEDDEDEDEHEEDEKKTAAATPPQTPPLENQTYRLPIFDNCDPHEIEPRDIIGPLAVEALLDEAKKS